MGAFDSASLYWSFTGKAFVAGELEKPNRQREEAKSDESRGLHSFSSRIYLSFNLQPLRPATFQGAHSGKATRLEDLRRRNARLITRAGAISNYFLAARYVL